MFHPEDTIGPYTLVRTLGRGAFGEVWLAERRSSLLTTRVALKMPLVAENELETVRQEAALWLQASGHPNIVPVLDAEVYDGQVVIASEYIAGGTLHEWTVSQGGKAPSLEDAVAITDGVLAGLDYLHRVGLTHRDLKPENVLLQDGIPRLTDFGLARVLKTQGQTDTISGTPRYMAPETFSGSYSVGSDLWAVGVMLYELLTGASPFPTQEMLTLILAIQNQEPAPLPDRLPERLCTIVTRLLAKTLPERYASASAVREALHSSLQPTAWLPAVGKDATVRPLHNLPSQPTSFVGRDREMAQLKAMLEQTHLLTLTGAGGCGKTRLSLQAAQDLLDEFPDGVWWVELASLTDPALVLQTVAEVLSVRESAGEPITKTLVAVLKGKQLLLILDNCEHLLDAAASLADTLLRGCPKVRLLVTSREALGIAGERSYRVPTLSLPGVKQRQTPDSLSQYEAVRLFAERAIAVKADFVVTEQNAPVVASVCHRLDGIPLAIELAAARLRAMTVEELGQRLADRFRILTGGSRTALRRHQTLREMVDWSYNLLDENQKVLLCRLSVFAGGWTLAGAEAVCTGGEVEDWAMLDLLTSLVDKSLVVAEPQQEHTRYHLLETIRQYARDRLRESGDTDRVHQQHRTFLVAFAEEAGQHLRGREQTAWLDRLEAEHDNLRAALESASDEAALRIVGAIWPFWGVRGYFSEGRIHLERALIGTHAQERTTLRARALVGAGGLASAQGDYVAAQAFYEEALTIQRELDNKKGVAACLGSLGSLTYSIGKYALAKRLYEEALALGQELADKQGIANSLHGLGSIAWMQGDPTAARNLYNESLALRREFGDRRGVTYSLHGLGGIERLEGNYSVARVLYTEALTIQEELEDRGGSTHSLNGLASISALEGDYGTARALTKAALTIQRELGDRAGIATSLNGFATLANREGEPRRAAILWGASQRLRDDVGAPFLPSERSNYEREVAQGRAALGEETFEDAWAEGQAMTIDQAIQYAQIEP